MPRAPPRQSASPVLLSSHCAQSASRVAVEAIVSAKRTTRKTSRKSLASPRLMRTTPSSWPMCCSNAASVTSLGSAAIASRRPRIDAAPPGLHMQPVRREMLARDAAYSTNVFGIIWPEGWTRVSAVRTCVVDRTTPLTWRKMSETTEPVSDCSPTARSRRVGVRERIRTTGVAVDSCRSADSEPMRWCMRQDRRSGRNGR